MINVSGGATKGNDFWHSLRLNPHRRQVSTHGHALRVAPRGEIRAGTEGPVAGRGEDDDPDFRDFLCAVLGIAAVHPYADDLSSINVHFASEGCELGWHFDNSSFAVTMLLQAPEGGGVFEYVAGVRNADAGEMAYDTVGAVLDGDHPVETLVFGPGDLVLFRGRNAMHRVTPTVGAVTRLLVVFAFNDRSGVALSDSALQTFYGRTAYLGVT